MFIVILITDFIQKEICDNQQSNFIDREEYIEVRVLTDRIHVMVDVKDGE